MSTSKAKSDPDSLTCRIRHRRERMSERDCHSKTISMLDHRYAVVKQMQTQIKELLDDSGGETFEAKALAGRAVFLLAQCEAREVSVIEGKEISYSEYCRIVKALIDVLHKLGLKRPARSAIRLSDYLAQAEKQPKRKKSKKKKKKHAMRCTSSKP